MELAPLIKMANQIGSFFEIYPDRDYAVHEVAGHIERFWNPRMRQTMLEHLDDSAALGLSPLAQAAFQKLAGAQQTG
jgi:formate dehydrogenase subunit delta